MLSPHARDVRRALAAAALLGVLADPLLRDGPWGLGLLVWVAALAATIVVLLRRLRHPLSGESCAWLATAVAFAAGLSWRDSEVLQAFDGMAMLAALALLAPSLGGAPVPGLATARVRDLIQSALGTGLDVATGGPRLLLRDAELRAALPPSNSLRRTARALVLAVPIFLVFFLLFADADPVFRSFFTLPDVNIPEAFSHVFVAGFFAWVVAGWLRRSLLAPRAADQTPSVPIPLALGTTDVALALGGLALLFAAFIAAQLGWLFGGEALVLRTTGLSYAEYARRGFFELTWVAALLLPLLLGTHALIPAASAAALRLYRKLSLTLTVLLGAVMASAFVRMELYVRYYGLSTDRLFATAFMIWLGIVFAWLALTVLRGRSRLFAAGMVVSGFVTLAALNVLNPDAVVARANLARGSAPGAGGADLRYVASLGGDAVPILLAALTAPGTPDSTAASRDRCTAAELVLRRWTGERRAAAEHDWTRWNLARSRAAQAVQSQEGALRQLACPRPAGR